MTDMFKGWKTVSFNLLAAVVPILELTELKGAIPEEFIPFYAIVVAVGNIYLRSVN